MENLKDRTCSFLQELIRVDSPSGRESGVARLVEQEMKRLHYDEAKSDELGSVVGIVRGKKPGPVVLFDAHMDVVPAGDLSAWQHGPFSGDLAEGRIYGRGATDVKGSLAALVVAIGSLDRNELHGTVLVSAGVGEEMIEGVALEHVLGHHQVDRVIICEPTGLRLGLGHKGRAGLLVTAEGLAAHTSQPDRGINAVYRMLEAVRRLRALPLKKDEILGSGIMELVEISSLPSPGGSMVPYACMVRFDRRLVRGETAESVRAEIGEALLGLDGVAFAYHQSELKLERGPSFTVDNFHPAWAQPQTSELAQTAQKALQAVGQKGEFYLAPYSTNGVAAAALKGLPTLVYGAGEIDVAHAVNESVAVDQIVGAAKGYQALALSLWRS